MRLTTWLTMIACAGLLSCTGMETGGGPAKIPRVKSVSAGGVKVTIAAPRGFCIDEATLDQNRKGAFVFLSDCAQLDGVWRRVPISAVLTASVSPSGLPGAEAGRGPALAALEGFLTNPPGVYTLGKSQVPEAIRALKSHVAGETLYVLVEDRAADNTDGASNRFWRAFTEVNGRLVALSVTGYTRRDREEARALKILEAFVATVIAANAVVS